MTDHTTLTERWGEVLSNTYGTPPVSYTHLTLPTKA